MKRALLGGTFDPPHIAHLVAGESAYRSLDVDVVTFVPAGQPWQKADRPVTPAEHRWKMIELALGGVDYFEADDREIKRDGWSYTIDTVRSFPADDQITLILGSDAAANLSTWHDSKALRARVSVAVADRPGTDRTTVEAAIGPVEWIDMPPIDVSGTDLRSRARSGRSIRFLVPDPVLSYIHEYALYSQN